MPVLINFKICDNSRDCSGFDVCPAKVFEWDENRKTIVLHNKRCIGCGKCRDCCPVGAIRFAKDEKEAEKIKEEIANDPRQVSDLFVDRYGASSILPSQQVDEETFKIRILGSFKVAVLEVYDDSSIQCLLKSIPMSELLKGMDVKYRKMKVDSKFMQDYDIKELPALLFFNNGKILGKIEGYYEEDRKEKLLEVIKGLLKDFKGS